jgi:hypothetical protein
MLPGEHQHGKTDVSLGHQPISPSYSAPELHGHSSFTTKKTPHDYKKKTHDKSQFG